MRHLLYKQFMKPAGIILLTVCCFSNNAKAQDPVFTQAFLSPIYLNPAATGAGEYDMRISAVYRRQWWTIPSQMQYLALSFDKYVPKINSGLGVLVSHSTEGYLKKTGIYGSYAYTVCAGTLSAAENGSMPKWFWTGGLQFGMAQRRIDYSKLVFADEIDVGGVIPGSVSAADPPINSGKWFPDFGAGMFFNYNLNDNSRLLIGASAHHINRPDESLVSTSDTVRSQLPVRWTGNLLYTFTNPQRVWSFSIGAIGYQQASHSSYQLGTEITQNEYDISLGFWYRGSVNFRNMNTFSVTLSLNLSGKNNNNDRIRAGLAHDAPIGQNNYSYTTGSSELGFVWDHNTYNSSSDNPCKPRISSASACPIRF